MIHAKTSLWLAIAFILIGGVAFWDSVKWNEERKEKRENKGKIFLDSDAAIRSMEYRVFSDKADENTKKTEIKFTCIQATGCTTNQDEWKMEKPEAWAVDRGRVIALASSIRSIQAVETVESNNLEEFGLAKPRATISVDWGSQGIVELEFGEDSPVGFNQYFRVKGKKEIYLVPNYLFRLLEHEPNYWREKIFFPTIRAEEIQEIRWKHSSQAQEIVVTRKEEDWFMEKPIQGRADSQYMDALLATVSSWQALKIISEKIPSKKLDKALSLTIHSRDNAQYIFQAAKETKLNKGLGAFFANSSLHKWWGEVQAIEVNRFARTPQEIRDPKLLSLSEQRKIRFLEIESKNKIKNIHEFERKNDEWEKPAIADLWQEAIIARVKSFIPMSTKEAKLWQNNRKSALWLRFKDDKKNTVREFQINIDENSVEKTVFVSGEFEQELRKMQPEFSKIIQRLMKEL